MRNYGTGSKGITLLEVLFVVVLVAFLVTTVSGIYIIAMRGADELGKHSDLHEKLSFAMERMSREVRPANAIQVSDQSLRYTVQQDGVDESFIYYLYNASDPWPPAFNQSFYELRKAELYGSIDNSFAYGSGELFARGLKPPPDTTITQEGKSVLFLMTAEERDTTFQLRSRIHARNG